MREPILLYNGILSGFGPALWTIKYAQVAMSVPECDSFPCEYLHPYSDQAMKPHNTKVFNLCRIKKVGIEEWAKNEAGDILDKYYYGKWTL